MLHCDECCFFIKFPEQHTSLAKARLKCGCRKKAVTVKSSKGIDNNRPGKFQLSGHDLMPVYVSVFMAVWKSGQDSGFSLSAGVREGFAAGRSAGWSEAAGAEEAAG